MPDAPAGSSAKSMASSQFWTRKVGPLPVWLWAAIAIGAWYWYEHYGPGSASAATTGPQVEYIEQDASSGTAATAFAGTRETAPGGQSLDKWAKDHGTTAGAVTTTTEEAAAAGKLDPANHAKFAGYLQHGTGRPMRKGLVFYAPAVDAGPDQPAADTTSEDPSAGTDGSTSPSAIAAAQAITPGTGPRQNPARKQPAKKPASGTSPPDKKEPAKKPASGTPARKPAEHKPETRTSTAGATRWRS